MLALCEEVKAIKTTFITIHNNLIAIKINLHYRLQSKEAGIRTLVALDDQGG
jgi:hypothetical protein